MAYKLLRTMGPRRIKRINRLAAVIAAKAKRGVTAKDRKLVETMIRSGNIVKRFERKRKRNKMATISRVVAAAVRVAMKTRKL